MRAFEKNKLVLAMSIALITTASASLAFAQDEKPENSAVEKKSEKTKADDKEGLLDLEEIIVTGTANWGAQTKFKASYGITTFDQKQIEMASPQSTADLLGEAPGIFTEGGTAGETGNNAYVRGIPSAGGFKFLPLLIDGLPAYEEPEVGFMNNDILVRADLMTEKVETVRGGPSAILYSHALGGAANFITRTGGDEYKGAIKTEVGDWGHLRNDFYLSGPINNNLTFAVGGYYRVSNGLRDPGYTANDGGQLRGNIVWKSDDRTTKVELHALELHDKTIFYQNIPFSIPKVGDKPTKDNPATIDHVEDLGIDFGKGTTLSNGLRTGTLNTQQGPIDYDLSDGIKADFSIKTLKVSKEFDSWVIENNMRTTKGTSGFNAMFTGVPVAFNQFITDRERNDVANKAFTAASSCDLTSVYLSYYSVDAKNCGTKLGTPDLTSFINKYKNYSQFGLRYADKGTLLDAQTTPIIGLNTLWLAQIGANMFVDDFKVHHKFDFLGEHNLTAGGYLSIYDLETNFRIAEIVTDTKSNAKLVDVVALSSSGSQIGPSLSKNGIYRDTSTIVNVNDKHQSKAIFVSDDWDVNKDLAINVGWRWQNLNIESNYNNPNNGEDLTPYNIKAGSTADNLADNTVVGLTGRITSSEANFTETAWTAGANYILFDDFAVFGRVSDSFRMPRSEVIWADRAQEDPTQRILQAEGGFKFKSDNFTGYVTAFWNDFKAVGTFHEYKDIADPACNKASGGLTEIDKCQLIQGIYRQGTKNQGVEVELSWTPTFVPNFELATTLTYQEPKFAGGDLPEVEAIQSQDDEGNFVTTGYKIVNKNLNGNVPQRFPKIMANLRPSYTLPEIIGIKTTLYGAAQYIGERFSTDQNENIFPGYWNFEMGALATLNDNLHMQLHVTNVNNAKTVTEGDPVNQNNLTQDGQRNLVLGRPLFGRTIKLALTYDF